MMNQALQNLEGRVIRTATLSFLLSAGIIFVFMGLRVLEIMAATDVVVFWITFCASFGYYQRKWPACAKEMRRSSRRSCYILAYSYASTSLFGIYHCWQATEKFRFGFMFPWSPPPNYDWREWCDLDDVNRTDRADWWRG